MSVFRWLGWGGSPGVDDSASDSLETAPKPASPSADLAAAPSDLSAWLASARGGSDEVACLAAIVAADRRGELEPATARAAAALFLERGRPDRALALVATHDEPASWLLACDASRELGDLSRALDLVERVLARDLDLPGARERHRALTAALGIATTGPAPALDGATLLRPGVDHGLRIVAEVGRGGAASVFEAIDDALGRRLALKVYHRPLEDRGQLLREARTLTRFAGRGVVRLYDADPELATLQTEWLAGGSLRRRLASAAPTAALPAALQPVVTALARIHAGGHVHGDVKPANLLFRDPSSLDGDVALCLSDFGLCVPRGTAAPGGTPGFLSPERLAGRPLQPDDDVFSLGGVIDAWLARADDPPAFWRPLADACQAPSGQRPEDAAAVARLLDAPRI